MATGASTADLAVILIDAKLGIQTQSKRHAFIVSLLGVPRVVVAINKMDLVGYDPDVYARIRDEYGAFAARLGFADLAFIPISALAGDNVVTRSDRMPWFDGLPLLTHLESVYIAGDANLIDFRFPVQRVVRPDAAFRGYAGQVVSGIARPGDEVVVLPSGMRTRITRIVALGPDRDYAFPPESVTLCLADDVDVSRGDMIAHPNNVPRVERAIEAMVVWMADAPLDEGRVYLVKHTTRTVKAACGEIVYRVNPDTLHREATTALGAERDRPRAIHAVPAAVRRRIRQEPRDRQLHPDRSGNERDRRRGHDHRAQGVAGARGRRRVRQHERVPPAAARSSRPSARACSGRRRSPSG